ncbi:arylacetamide deacetylase-like 4 [Eublepharis macularius]|uniref:Arylacetamide deacetylase-like 4 n=1 Tax=Eublepharis macularius TaxID=481883 RepID=A0AA97KI78_EUBMA|nr:arylacetamide deacetylase-like 4 [Eublepharis macularius]
MGFLYALLLLVVAAFIGAVILVVVGSIYFDATNSEIPPGVEQPAKLRIIHAFLIGSAVVGRILENLHICSQLQFIRYLRSGPKLGKDTKLFIKDTKFKHVPVRIYQPKAPSAGRRKGVVFFHGGGWMFGSIRSYDKMCRYISKESEAVVVSVEYRLAPEYKYPAQLNDCLAATTHFLQNANDYGVDETHIIVAGDSAGGSLAAGVCQTLVGRRGLAKVYAQILIYPGLQAIDFNLPSYQQNQAVPVLYREKAAFYFLHYLNGEASLLEEVLQGSHVPVDQKLHYRKWLSADNIPKEFKARGYKPSVPVSCAEEVYGEVKCVCGPEISPLLAEDTVVRQLPQTYILTCEYDVLRDDGLLYKKRLEDNGVPVTWYHVINGFHGIINFFDKGWLTFPSGKKGLDNIVRFIQSL